jgi:hypothetical protein
MPYVLQSGSKRKERENERVNTKFERGEICSRYRTDENMYKNLIRKPE